MHEPPAPAFLGPCFPDSFPATAPGARLGITRVQFASSEHLVGCGTRRAAQMADRVFLPCHLLLEGRIAELAHS